MLEKLNSNFLLLKNSIKGNRKFVYSKFKTHLLLAKINEDKFLFYNKSLLIKLV